MEWKIDLFWYHILQSLHTQLFWWHTFSRHSWNPLNLHGFQTCLYQNEFLFCPSVCFPMSLLHRLSLRLSYLPFNLPTSVVWRSEISHVTDNVLTILPGTSVGGLLVIKPKISLTCSCTVCDNTYVNKKNSWFRNASELSSAPLQPLQMQTRFVPLQSSK